MSFYENSLITLDNKSLQTYGTLLTFVMAMMLYPDVAKRAQDELDRVVGRDRVPTFADFDDLPYVQAMVRETLRWRPVGPLGRLM